MQREAEAGAETDGAQHAQWVWRDATERGTAALGTWDSASCSLHFAYTNGGLRTPRAVSVLYAATQWAHKGIRVLAALRISDQDVGDGPGHTAHA